MARPAPARRNSRARGKSGGGGRFVRGLFLICFGFTAGVGSAAFFAAYVNDLPIPLATPPTRDANQPVEDSKRRGRRETLEFHETLQEQRAAPVAAPEEQIFTPQPESEPDNAGRRFVYYLQLGSFQRQDAAEELRGQLALSGSAAQIRTGESGGGKVFRVWMGPYQAEEDAENVRGNLALQGYNQIQLLKLAERSNNDG